MKLFLAVWLIVSMMAASIAFAPHPLPTKDILILNINGQIDGALLKSFSDYFEANPEPPDFLILRMSSEGGYYLDALLLARGLRSMENLGIRVYFLADGQCTSGCYLLASFANQVFATPNTKMGFNHTYDEVRDIYPQIQVLLYANNRLIISGITVLPRMDSTTTPCSQDKDGNFLLIDATFVDGCTENLDLLVNGIQSNSSYTYSIKTVTLEANAKLGTA